MKCTHGSTPTTDREAARDALWRSELTGMDAEQTDWELGRGDDGEDEQ